MEHKELGLIKNESDDSECVYDVAFSSNGKWLASGSRDKNVAGEILQYHFGYSGFTNGVTVRIWDVNPATFYNL